MPSFKARTIVFTSFRKEAVENPKDFVRDLAKDVDWVYGQIEKCPNTGKEHFQGMAFSKENRTWGIMKPDHIEKCQDPHKSLEYCSKDETRIHGPYEAGIRPTWNVKGQKLKNLEIINTPLTQLIEEDKIHIRDYEKIRKCINLYNLDKKTNDRDPDENLWIQGPPGVGKSYWVRQQYPELYVKAQNKWWDGYNGEESVLIDDFDKQGTCLAHYLKLWGDRYNLTGEIKGGTVKLNFRRLIITSNYSIPELFGTGPTPDLSLVAAIERRFTSKDMVARGKFD